MEQITKYVTENFSHWAGVLIGAVVVVVLTRLLILFLQKLIRRSYDHRKKNLPPERQQQAETAATMLCSLVKYLAWLLAIAALLGLVGLTGAMTSLIATAGIGGIALGIGAQSLVKDVAAGIFMLFESQIRVGDYVNIAGKTGMVEEMALRNTTLLGPQKERIVVPNGSIDVLTNYSRSQYMSLVDVSVAYEADVALARRLIQEEAEAYGAGRGIGKVQVLGVTELGDSGVTLRLSMFADYPDHWQAERDIRERILRRFQQEGVEIPYQKIMVLEGKSS